MRTMDDQEIKSAASELSRLGASKGGKARASVLTPAERKEISRAAVIARWKKAKGENYVPSGSGPEQGDSPLEGGKYPARGAATDGSLHSIFPGTLRLGGLSLECHVLNDGRRVFTQRELVRVLTGGVRTGDLRRYLSSLSIQRKTTEIALTPIEFKIPNNPTPARGLEATALIEICEAYLEAREQELLQPNQQHIARQAEIITRACAKVGVIALIDEATGFQKYREKQSLQIKLQAFIAEELQEWARMFPEDFWLELARLEGVHYSARSRPLRWGKYVMAFVYDAVDSDIGKKLREINPDPHFRQNHHQWLKEFGRDKVNNQIHKVIGAMQACETMDEFRTKFARVFKKLPTQLFLDFGDLSFAQRA